MKNLRVGLIGIGRMGKNHARILSSLEGVHLVGVVDPFADYQFDKENINPNLFSEINDLIKLNIDYCVISTPTITHRDISIEMLNAGIHCLIEKPLAMNASEAKEIKEIADEKSLIVGIGYVERYNCAVREMKKRLVSGQLGKVYQISTQRKGPNPERIRDIGVVKDLATHDIDLTMWLSDSKFRNLFAQTDCYDGTKHESILNAIGILENDVQVNMQVNWLNPVKQREILILGEKGIFKADTLNSDLIYCEYGKNRVSQEAIAHFKGSATGTVVSYSFDKTEPLLSEHESFRDRIFGKDAEIISIDEGIEVLNIAESMLENATINRKLRV